eukprot:TRINITY_DN2840_c0_g1_i2.p3 TRINITY_DN2840_c0_g1~~TRINITY_DN2840_c0_g1_i2.p3  ORF type:complete len:109 (-),score=21.31 TRINITY_DN2840_c0_g1_i2:75-401(-)
MTSSPATSPHRPPPWRPPLRPDVPRTWATGRAGRAKATRGRGIDQPIGPKETGGGGRGRGRGTGRRGGGAGTPSAGSLKRIVGNSATEHQGRNTTNHEAETMIVVRER